MRSYVGEGNLVTLTTPAAIATGAGLLVGGHFGITCGPAGAGQTIECLNKGEFTVTKNSAEAWAVGDTIYWNDTTKVFTTTSSGNTQVGFATEIAVNPSASGSLLLVPKPGGVVSAVTDPVTGGSTFSAGGWFYGAGGIVPASATSAGIVATMAEVSNRGGGVVQLLPIEYTIDADIPLVSGVSLVGVPNAPSFGASDDVPDFWEVGTNGTRFNLSAGVTAFTWNATDKGSPEANIMANALRQVRIYGIAFSGGLRAIKIGAYQAVGCMFGELDEVYAYNQTGDYAFDIQNCQFFRQGRIRVRNALAGGGGGYRYSNTLNTDLFTGDSLIEEIYARCTSPKSKGVVFEAAGPSGSLLNDVKVTGRIHSSRYGSGTPTTSARGSQSPPSAGFFTPKNYFTHPAENSPAFCLKTRQHPAQTAGHDTNNQPRCHCCALVQHPAKNACRTRCRLAGCSAGRG